MKLRKAFAWTKISYLQWIPIIELRAFWRHHVCVILYHIKLHHTLLLMLLLGFLIQG